MLIFFDFEVLKSDWLVCIHDEEDHRVCYHNDVEGLRAFYNKHMNDTWIGYKVKGYDQFIMRSALNGDNPKSVNDFIIAGGQAGWKYPGMNELCSQYPMVLFDVSNMESLKRLEAYMGGDITETTVPFDLDRACTADEIKQLEYYCHKDVEATIKVFKLKLEEYQSSRELVDYFNLPDVDLVKTKAQLSAKVLGARKTQRNDIFDYTIPDNHSITKYTDVVKFYEDRIGSAEAQANDEYCCDIGGCPHVFKFGGLHGALPCYEGEGKFINMDVASYYPSLMIEYNLISRNISDPNKFKEIYEKRLKYKAEKDPRQAPLKIVLNSTYGASKDQFNDLYDPKMATSVCVHGQIFLLDLLEHLEPYCKVIQSNTDGVLIKCETDEDVEFATNAAHDWSLRTGMKLEYDYIKKVVQKDVNNYIIVMNDGKIKSKGLYVKKQSKLDYELPIVNRAVTEYLLNNTPVESTIRDKKNKLIEYQQVFKLTSKYEHSELNGQKITTKVNRVFASTDEKDGQLLKCRAGTSAKYGNSPAHCRIINTDVNIDVPDWLDYNFYIDMANKRIQDFKECKKVATKKKEEAPKNADLFDVNVEYSENAFDLLFTSIVPLEADTKKAIDKFDNAKNRKPLDTLNNYCCAGGFLRDDVIYIDFDVMADAEKWLNHMKEHNLKGVVIKTFKGMHFYYKKPKEKLKGFTRKGVKQDAIIALGCHVDIGYRHYAVIRENSQNREVIYNNGLSELPAILYPLGVAEDNQTVASCRKDVEVPKRDGTKGKKEGYFSLSNLGEGSRNSTLTSWTGTIHTNYPNMTLHPVIATVNALMLEKPLPHSEIREIAQHVTGYITRNDDDEAQKALKPYEDCEENGELKGYHSTQSSVNTALQFESVCGYSVYYDTYIDQLVLEDKEGIHQYNDDIRTEIICNLERFGFKPNKLKDLVRDGVSYIGSKNKKDTAIKELNKLPLWDEKDRFEEAGRKLGIADPEQARIWFTVFMLGTVRRLMSVEATKHDMAHIIKGPQGYGKSTFFEEIALKREWYTDSVNPSDPEDKIARLQRGMQICEIAEMVGFSVKGDAATKRLLSKKENHLNEKYKETVKVLPIRCVICGTTNENELITDPTGSRRFAISEITSRCDIQYFKDNKHQLYAQAIAQQENYLDAYYKAENFFTSTNKEFNIEGIYTGKLMSLQNADACIVGHTTAEIAENNLGIEIKSLNKGVRNEIAKNLRFIGYELIQKKINGKVCKVWNKPIK